jgi:isopentenyl diphosphate isomerase/L-lactate dehydrogenase-like FMN-dependent dehydrogenase
MLGPVEPLNLEEYERLAAERLEPATFGYLAGGAGDELTLRDNVEAYRRWQLRPRVLVDVSAPSTSTTVLGEEISSPVLVAPVAYQRLVHPEGEVAMARAAAAAGTIMCLSSFATASWEEVASTGARRWFQLYVPADDTRAAELAAAAGEAGFGALLLTVDTPVLGRRERDLRLDFALPDGVEVPLRSGRALTPVSAFATMSASVSWERLERLAAVSRLPIVLKGILTAEDARIACEQPVAAIVVSNHGGRQLDGVAATIDALPEIVEAVEGRLEVLIDGGIRRGADVVKALALGARAVLVGRPPVWGLSVAGEAGAQRVLELLRDEIELALQLVGCRVLDDLSPAHVRRRAR